MKFVENENLSKSKQIMTNYSKSKQKEIFKMEDLIFTLKEAAGILKISVPIMRELIDNNKVKFIQISPKCIRISLDCLKSYISENAIYLHELKGQKNKQIFSDSSQFAQISPKTPKLEKSDKKDLGLKSQFLDTKKKFDDDYTPPSNDDSPDLEPTTYEDDEPMKEENVPF